MQLSKSGALEPSVNPGRSNQDDTKIGAVIQITNVFKGSRFESVRVPTIIGAISPISSKRLSCKDFGTKTEQPVFGTEQQFQNGINCSLLKPRLSAAEAKALPVRRLVMNKTDGLFTKAVSRPTDSTQLSGTKSPILALSNSLAGIFPKKMSGPALLPNLLPPRLLKVLNFLFKRQ